MLLVPHVYALHENAQIWHACGYIQGMCWLPCLQQTKLDDVASKLPAAHVHMSMECCPPCLCVDLYGKSRNKACTTILLTISASVSPVCVGIMLCMMFVCVATHDTCVSTSSVCNFIDNQVAHSTQTLQCGCWCTGVSEMKLAVVLVILFQINDITKVDANIIKHIMVAGC